MHVWLSGQKQWTHNPSPIGYRRFKPCCMQLIKGKGMVILAYLLFKTYKLNKSNIQVI